jgi:hypothetical protein
MPCKRCRHLRRSCEFNEVPAREEWHEPHTSRSVKELKDRAMYMERILQHHFPNLGVDVTSLRHACATLSSREGIDQDRSNVQLPDTISNAPIPDNPEIEDENCTLDYVDGTTVRTW